MASYFHFFIYVTLKNGNSENSGFRQASSTNERGRVRTVHNRVREDETRSIKDEGEAILGCMVK